jgi:hypothetical protein
LGRDHWTGRAVPLLCAASRGVRVARGAELLRAADTDSVWLRPDNSIPRRPPCLPKRVWRRRPVRTVAAPAVATRPAPPQERRREHRVAGGRVRVSVPPSPTRRRVGGAHLIGCCRRRHVLPLVSQRPPPSGTPLLRPAHTALSPVPGMARPPSSGPGAADVIRSRFGPRARLRRTRGPSRIHAMPYERFARETRHLRRIADGSLRAPSARFLLLPPDPTATNGAGVAAARRCRAVRTSLIRLGALPRRRTAGSTLQCDGLARRG